MDAYATWLKVCDWLTAIATGGRMHEDFPEYDWYASWSWGEHPLVAVRGAMYRSRCSDCGFRLTTCRC